MDTVHTNEACIDICNGLLRGELSAVETYSQAIDKYAGNPVVPELQRIRSEHVTAASLLSVNVRSMGGTPSTDSGAWGIFAKTVQGAANLFGAESAMESLQRGEETGLKGYQNALGHEDVMQECKDLIRDELVPPIHRHISTLEGLEDAV